MFKKILLTAVCVSFGAFVIASSAHAQGTTTSTTTKQTVTAPVKKAAATVETTESTVTTTPAAPRPVYDQATLKKMNNTLCIEGFDAKVGNDNKNICSGKATAPDLAYSCIWMKKGDGTFAPTLQGPCNLDNSEHRGSIVITKADYKSSPPLSYGTKAECCYRAAKGPSTTSSTSSTTVSPLKKK